MDLLVSTLEYVVEGIRFHAVNTTLWMLIPVLVIFFRGLLKAGK